MDDRIFGQLLDAFRDRIQKRLDELRSTRFPRVRDGRTLDDVVGRAVADAIRIHHRRDELRARFEALGRERGAAQATLKARNLHRYRGPAAVMALLDLAQRERLRDPEASYHWADAAAYLAERDLEETKYQGLRARALAERGNALRLKMDYSGARTTLQRARAVLGRHDQTVFGGEFLSLCGSLEASLHRIEEALAYVDRALENFRTAEFGIEDLLIQRAHLLVYKGDLSPALKDLTQALEVLLQRGAQNPRRLLTCCHNAVYALVEIALTSTAPDERAEALAMSRAALYRLGALYELVDAPAWLARGLWVQGRLHYAEDMPGTSSMILDSAISSLLECRQTVAAAVASLDLILVRARIGDLEGIRETATSACRIFESSGLEPDLWAAVRVVEHCEKAAEAETLILETLKKVGGASLRRTPAGFILD